MGPLHPTSYTKMMTAKKAKKMDTCEEFWKLCWMTGSRVIVMLCEISPGFQVGFGTYIENCLAMVIFLK